MDAVVGHVDHKKALAINKCALTQHYKINCGKTDGETSSYPSCLAALFSRCICGPHLLPIKHSEICCLCVYNAFLVALPIELSVGLDMNLPRTHP